MPKCRADRGHDHQRDRGECEEDNEREADERQRIGPQHPIEAAAATAQLADPREDSRWLAICVGLGPGRARSTRQRHSTRGSKSPYRTSAIRLATTTPTAKKITTPIVPLKLYFTIDSKA